MTTCTTCSRTCRRCAEAHGPRSSAALLSAAIACRRCRAATLAQRSRLDPAALLKPPADSWPTYHGDYSGQRHSTLTQITPENVASAHAGVGVPDRADAADQGHADSRQRHHLHHDARQHLGDRRAHRRGSSGATPIPPNKGFHIGHRGAAVYKDSVYLTTPDAHLVALDAQHRQGEVERRDRRREAAATGPPTRRWSSATT